MKNILENIVIRPMQEADIEEAMKIKEAEGWNQTEKDWRLMLAHDPGLCFVADINDRVVGTVTALNFSNQVAWIGMMLVSKDFRGLGIGKLLLQKVINQLKECKSIKLDATLAGMIVYTKLGFVKEFEIYRMTTMNLPKLVDQKQQIAIVPVSRKDIADIVKMESALFGADRSKLIEMLLQAHPNMAWLLKREGRLSGFALGRPGSHYTQIGPVMAETANDATALISGVLKYFTGQPVVVDVPEDKQRLKDWLLSLGFVVRRPLTRMYLKSNSFPGLIEKQFLIGGPEIG